MAYTFNESPTPRPRQWKKLAIALSAALTLAPVSACAPDDPWPSEVLRGITIASHDNLDEIIEAVENLSSPPTVRIVVDSSEKPSDIRPLVDGLDPHAQLMMTVVDSTQMAQLSAEDIRQRTTAFIDVYASQVDVWEIGNELNGQWVGDNPQAINEKVSAASKVVEAAGERSAITLNYWHSADCYSKEWEETISYSQTLPDEVMKHLDLLMLSVYETACSPIQRPNARDLARTFIAIGEQAPRAQLAIGEFGAQGVEDGMERNPTPQYKADIARRYMSMNAELTQLVGRRFVGGWFWWYFAEDAVPMDAPDSLWTILDELLTDL
ncbi:MAG: hypothetical protein Q4C87_02880 [Actinomycetaceae bacterium]|nr:hypothetical protein [Actinomycetaceae bacterium]